MSSPRANAQVPSSDCQVERVSDGRGWKQGSTVLTADVPAEAAVEAVAFGFTEVEVSLNSRSWGFAYALRSHCDAVKEAPVSQTPFHAKLF